MTLNLNQLRVFRSVCDAGSITGAARELRISQPAASKQLAELEASLGVTLVDRLPRGVRLTAGGEILRRHAQRLFQEEEAAERAVRDLLGLERGSLAVGASTTIGSYLIPSIFGALHARHPQVTLELAIGNTAHVQQLLLEGRLDVGVTEGSLPSEGLSSEVFARDEMVLIVSPSHPLAARAAVGGVDPQELVELPFVVREVGSGTREVVEEALARRHIRVTPVMTLGSTEAIKNAVARGFGAAIVSCWTVELEVASGRLVPLPLRGFSVHRDLHLSTLSGKEPSPASREFMRALREAPRARHPFLTSGSDVGPSRTIDRSGD